MNKPSFMFLLLFIGISALAVYQATFQTDASIAFVRFMGDSSFLLICASLLIGPLVVAKPAFASLIEPRRAVGITAFIFSMAHAFLAFSLYFGYNPSMIVSTIPLIGGAAAFAILLPIFLTSNDWALSKLGMGKWKLIQRLNYLVFAISFVHFVSIEGILTDLSVLASQRGALVLLGIITIVAQLAGFFIMRSRKKSTGGAAGNPDSSAQATEAQAAAGELAKPEASAAPEASAKPASKAKAAIAAKP